MKTLEFRQYQADAAQWLAKKRRGYVVAPAGSGKSLIGAMALSIAIQARQRTTRPKIGWMANTWEQCSQAEAAMDQFPAIQSAADVVIRCAAAQADWSDCDVMVCDEFHHCGTAATWQEQVASCPGARWGLSATPGEDPEALVILGQLFGESYVIDRSQVAHRLSKARVILLDATDDGMDFMIDNRIAKLKRQRVGWWRRGERAAAERDKEAAIRVANFDFAMEATRKLTALDAELHMMASWQACVELGIIANVSRNQEAVAVARRHVQAGDHCLVLVNQVEHGQSLAEAIPGSIVVYSKMGAKKRKAALEAFTAGDCLCLVATSLLDEGADLPIANVLVMISGGRSNAKVEQRTGRVLRTWAGKDGATIYDFEDFQHPLMRKHAMARQRLYAKLGYTVEQQRKKEP